jgi:hypothetical protein
MEVFFGGALAMNCIVYARWEARSLLSMMIWEHWFRENALTDVEHACSAYACARLESLIDKLSASRVIMSACMRNHPSKGEALIISPELSNLNNRRDRPSSTEYIYALGVSATIRSLGNTKYEHPIASSETPAAADTDTATTTRSFNLDNPPSKTQVHHTRLEEASASSLPALIIILDLESLPTPRTTPQGPTR